MHASSKLDIRHGFLLRPTLSKLPFRGAITVKHTSWTPGAAGITLQDVGKCFVFAAFAARVSNVLRSRSKTCYACLLNPCAKGVCLPQIARLPTDVWRALVQHFISVNKSQNQEVTPLRTRYLAVFRIDTFSILPRAK